MDNNFLRKLTSRKFWMAVAACLMSLYATVGAFETEAAKTIGLICFVASAAIYAAVEAYTDAAHKEGDRDDAGN